VPALSQKTQDELAQFIPIAGGSIRNPIDCGRVFVDVSLMARAVELVAIDPVVDILILMPHLNIAQTAGSEQVNKLMSYMADFARNNTFGKPVVIVFHSFIDELWENELREKIKAELVQKGVAVYSSLSGASRALARFSEYHRIQFEINI
jgi:acyl-CoA synthetase (NDP forming)